MKPNRLIQEAKTSRSVKPRAPGPKLDAIIAKMMGAHIAERPSTNERFPTQYRWHWKDGSPINYPGGGFFGFGWCTNPGAPPQFSTYPSDSAHLKAWLRNNLIVFDVTHGPDAIWVTNFDSEGRGYPGAKVLLWSRVDMHLDHAEELAVARFAAGLVDHKVVVP